MAKLHTALVKQQLDRQLTTLVIQATTWWETGPAHVKLQEYGLGVHLPVRVCCYYPACVYVRSGVKQLFVCVNYRR